MTEESLLVEGGSSTPAVDTPAEQTVSISKEKLEKMSRQLQDYHRMKTQQNQPKQTPVPENNSEYDPNDVDKLADLVANKLNIKPQESQQDNKELEMFLSKNPEATANIGELMNLKTQLPWMSYSQLYKAIWWKEQITMPKTSSAPMTPQPPKEEFNSVEYQRKANEEFQKMKQAKFG